MNPTEKFLFEVMDQIEGTVKQVKGLAKDVSDTLTPVAEEAASYLEKATTTVSDRSRRFPMRLKLQQTRKTARKFFLLFPSMQTRLP